MEVNKANLTKGFLSYVEAKRKQALYLKLFFVSATFIVLAVLYYSYSIVKHANDNVLVVSTGGEILPVESTELEELYKALLVTPLLFSELLCQ